MRTCACSSAGPPGPASYGNRPQHHVTFKQWLPNLLSKAHICIYPLSPPPPHHSCDTNTNGRCTATALAMSAAAPTPCPAHTPPSQQHRLSSGCPGPPHHCTKHCCHMAPCHHRCCSPARQHLSQPAQLSLTAPAFTRCCCCCRPLHPLPLALLLLLPPAMPPLAPPPLQVLQPPPLAPPCQRTPP